MDGNQKKLKDEQEQVLEEIKKSYGKKRLIPFIGAGFSKNIEGYPDWANFVKLLSKKLGETEGFLEKLTGGNTLQAVEYFMLWKLVTNNRISEKEWYSIGKDYIKDELGNLFQPKTFDNNNWQAQMALIKLKNIFLIYTTNWDDTLEKTCDEILGKGLYKLYYTVSQLETLKKDYYENMKEEKNERKRLIIKLHGHYSDSNSIIASEYDYYNRMNTFNELDIIFQNDLLLNDFLFVGFSFNDVNINYLLYQINDMRKRVNPNNHVYLISILKPDYYYYELYKIHKKVSTYFLFKDLEEYKQFSQLNDDGKTETLRTKTVKFLDDISK